MSSHLLSLTLLLGSSSFSLAEDPTIVALTPFPPSLNLRGADDAPQLLITGKSLAGRDIDLSNSAAYTSSNPNVVKVSPEGRVYPVGNGSAEIVVSHSGLTSKIPVAATAMEAPLPINFANQVNPVFTKLGCNSGGCHGKIQGQNGFRLSLLGFDPEGDYANLLKEARGRRVFPAAPEKSLVLMKATGAVAHGGGKKIEPDSEEYKVVRRWIASGLPYGMETDPVVTRISVHPEHRVIDRNQRQQLVVHAHYSDGATEDVTRRAQYESNEVDVATVSELGVVNTLGMTGQSGIMARYQGFVSVFRATVPRPGETPAFDFAAKTVVDKHTAAKWRELGITPSELCSDEIFIRRVSLDITGTLPTPASITAFVADKTPAKRDHLVDRLLESPEYSYYFANKWADVLRVKRRAQPDRAFGTFAFHNWIRDAIVSDKPYDEFTRDIICAIGDETKSPPTVWFKEVQTPEQFVDDVSQVFMGQRLACANCHHHPYEKWSQDDYWGVAAFFSRVGKKNLPVPGKLNNNQNGKQQVFVKAAGSVVNKRTAKTAEMKPLDGGPMQIGVDEDPRQRFTDWLTAPKNPFFARAVANRYWAHFLGRGIVDPLDDMRITNPPSNPELLDALAADLVENKYSLKSLIRTICKSRTYQLSSEPNAFNESDKQSFARYYPKRLGAEVVYDALARVTDSPGTFAGLPSDSFAPNRAIMLPDESFQSYFLDVFGRPQRISACECERVNEASLAMSLHLLNSDEVQGKIARAGGRADRLAKDPRPDSEKVEELFLWTVGHKPTPKQLEKALEQIEKNEKNEQSKKLAYENIMWALLNSKGFLFNR